MAKKKATEEQTNTFHNAMSRIHEQQVQSLDEDYEYLGDSEENLSLMDEMMLEELPKHKGKSTYSPRTYPAILGGL